MNTLSTIRFSGLAGGWFAALVVVLLTAAGGPLQAASVRDIAPTEADAPVMLESANLEFGNFASFTSNPNNRLVATLGSADEVMYFGLSPDYNRDGDDFTNLGASRYRFQVRRISDGVVVHGPFNVDNNSANVNSYAEAQFGSYDATSRVINGATVYRFAPGQAGDYSIEFQDIGQSTNQDNEASRVLIPFWDFTVTDADDNPIEGRVWSRSWAFRTPPNSALDDFPVCQWDKEFNGQLYSYTEDGFVSRIDFADAGFAGLSFDVAFNSTGPGTSGDLAQDRMSVPGRNVTGQAAQHRIFLSLPDETLFPSGDCGSVSAATSFSCDGPGVYCLDVTVSDPGQVEVVLDFNGNGILDDNSLDVSLVFEFTPGNLSACIPWDGLRGDGTAVSGADTVDLFINYAQGIQHWAAYDVEFMRNGFCVETVRPTCAQQLVSNVLYWDDRDIPEDPGTGAPKDNRSGADCRAVPRSWNNFDLPGLNDCSDFNVGDDDITTGYGDKSTLNTYWFANTQIEFRARVPVVNVSIEGETIICEGGMTTLTATTNDNVTSYEWTGPGIDGSTTTQSITVTEPGEYCVTVATDNGCTNTVCVNVDVLDFTVDQFPDSLFLCFGDSVQILGSNDPSLVYEWSPATNIDDVNSAQPTVYPTETTTYSVTVTNNEAGGNCQAVEDVVVTVSPEIGLQVTGGGPICEANATITATTVNPADLQLLNEDREVLGTTSPFVVAVSGPANYTVIATNADGCVDSVAFNITGGPVDIALQDTFVTCLADELVLSVENLDDNDTLEYSWAPADLFEAGTATTANPIVAAPAGLYDVTLTATNQFGCSTEEMTTIFVIDENDALSFETLSECDGLTVRFNNTSTVGFGYLWLFGDGTFSTEENPSHTYPAPGDYTVTLRLIVDQECVAPFTQTVAVREQGIEADFTAALVNCTGDGAELAFTDATINVTGEDLTYSWTFTGTTPTTSTEANPTVTVNESGTITVNLNVRSTSDCISDIDSTFTVELNQVGLRDEITLCPGESAELNPGGEGDGRMYTWSPAPDFDANDPNPTTSTPGLYSVTITSDFADINCETVDMINVIEGDSIELVIFGPNGPLTGPDAPGTGGGPGGGGTGGGMGGADVAFPTVRTCGEAVDLSVDLTTGGEGLMVTYTDINGNDLGDGTGIQLSNNDRDTIIVSAVNADGCMAMDTIVIINSQVDAAIDADADGLSFCTSTDTSVTVINNNPMDTLTFAWQPNDIITGPLDMATVQITSPDMGSVDLSVVVTNQFGCDTTITVTISDIPFMPNMFPDTVAPCFAESFTIIGGEAVPGYTYEYNSSQNLITDDPANPVGNFTVDNTITVTITDPATGCQSVQDIFVDVAPEISFMAMPTDTAVCEPTMVTVTGSTVNENAVITWYNDADLMDVAEEGPTVTINAAEVGQSYTVFGQAVDPTSGCEQVIPVTVTVSAISTGLPLADVTACSNTASPSIFGENGPGAGLVYEIEPEDAVTRGDDGDITFTGQMDQDLTVTVTDPATGCTETATVAAIFTNVGDIEGMATPSTISLGDNSVLTVMGCTSDDCGYTWGVPTGTIDPDSTATVTATPDEVGSFIYEVDVTTRGCMVMLDIPLTVEDPLCENDRVFVPNAFSPNGDNVNDVMRVRSNFAEFITEFRFIIYDRWGQEVYNSEDINESWNGTQEGDDLEPDVYGYWLRTVCPTGEELIQQGNITLLR